MIITIAKVTIAAVRFTIVVRITIASVTPTIATTVTIIMTIMTKHD